MRTYQQRNAVSAAVGVAIIVVLIIIAAGAYYALTATSSKSTTSSSTSFSVATTSGSSSSSHVTSLATSSASSSSATSSAASSSATSSSKSSSSVSSSSTSTSSKSSSASSTTSSTASNSSNYTINVANNATLGGYLVNSTGFTLYYYAPDQVGNATSPPVSQCTGSCSSVWPAFYASKITVPSGLNASDFTTFKRSDGSNQTAYNGHPLYLYTKDTSPGQTNGQGVGGSWYVVPTSSTATFVKKS
jgi:predicted lipoprotein with Yx(FWY)xxD motif